MQKVDFGHITIDGVTIFRACFHKYLKARFILKKLKNEWSKLISKTEKVFFFLVEQGNKNGYNVDKILEIPAPSGETCFQIASQCSEKICKYIIGRRIKIVNIGQ